MGPLTKTTRQLLTVFAVVAAAGLFITYGGQCAAGGGQFRQIGEEMQSELKAGRIPQSYKYVADPRTHQYWPNKPQYELAIPDTVRVYILNDKKLEQLKGYQPGPL